MRIYQKKQPVPVSMVTEIRDAVDRAVVREEQSVPADRFSANRSADFQWTLPIAQLAAGPYLVTVTATADKNQAQRSMQIVVR